MKYYMLNVWASSKPGNLEHYTVALTDCKDTADQWEGSGGLRFVGILQVPVIDDFNELSALMEARRIREEERLENL